MDRSADIKKHMEVIGSDGVRVGIIDSVDGQRIKLTRADAADNHHHYVALSDVSRVDEHVHLGVTSITALAGGVAGARAAPLGGARGESRTTRSYLPWVLIGLALLAALLLIRTCAARRDAVAPTTAVAPASDGTAPLPVQTVTLPNGQAVDLAPNSLNYTLQQYLASNEATPRTFTFDKLNFDTSSAAIRPADAPNVDALAQILIAYPQARARIVGYTDARGAPGANAGLGEQRADALVAALVAKGVPADRLTAVSGGESNPADTNATGEGRFENRRTELVVTAK